MTAARLASQCLMETRKCFTIPARLIARALFSAPASRLRERADEEPHSAACLARIPRVNWGFLSTDSIKILMNTNAIGSRSSYELSAHSSWMEACGCNRRVSSPWRGVRLGRLSFFLWKRNLDLADCCARSKVGTNSMLELLRIVFWYRILIFDTGSSCPVPAWAKTPWRECVVSVKLPL